MDDISVFYESYLFIEPTNDVIRVEVRGPATSMTWATLAPSPTDTNNQGYMYGTGYLVCYRRYGSYQLPNITYPPNMEVRLTNKANQTLISVLYVTLGNFKRSFPGGKEYEAIITRVEE